MPSRKCGRPSPWTGAVAILSPRDRVPDVDLDPSTLDQLADAVVERLAVRVRAEADRLIDLKELADRLGLSTRGVTGLVARGELPEGYLIGGVRRWNWEGVERHLTAQQGRVRRKGRGR